MLPVRVCPCCRRGRFDSELRGCFRGGSSGSGSGHSARSRCSRHGGHGRRRSRSREQRRREGRVLPCSRWLILARCSLRRCHNNGSRASRSPSAVRLALLHFEHAARKALQRWLGQVMMLVRMMVRVRVAPRRGGSRSGIPVELSRAGAAAASAASTAPFLVALAPSRRHGRVRTHGTQQHSRCIVRRRGRRRS